MSILSRDGRGRAEFNSLLGRLKTFRIPLWGEESRQEFPEAAEEAPLVDSHVASSALKRIPINTLFGAQPDEHIVALDIDYPAYLIPSSTPGHSHLYIDYPMSWENYVKVLDVLAEVGLLETGYVEVSKKRGHTDLRLPWIRKRLSQRGDTADQVDRAHANLIPKSEIADIDSQKEF